MSADITEERIAERIGFLADELRSWLKYNEKGHGKTDEELSGDIHVMLSNGYTDAPPCWPSRSVLKHWIGTLDSVRSQLAALQSVPQGGQEIMDELLTALEHLLEDTQHRDHDCGDEWCPVDVARRVVANARLVPTPPQPAPGAVIKVEEFRREDRYVVLKRTDLKRHATPAQLRELERTCGMVRAGRATEGKRLKSYVVVADNWPEYEETWAKIQARVTGIPQPIQPEERRVGPDEVVVDYMALLGLLGVIGQRKDTFRLGANELEDYEAIRHALRASAQDHNGEGAK